VNSDESQPKVVRVLNLWQRNGVFTSEVIQPLLDMANPSHLPTIKSSPKTQSAAETSTEANNEANFVMQLRHFTSSLALSKSTNGSNFAFPNNGESSSQIKFNKKLLDFDYGDDDDDEKGETPTEAEPPTSSMLTKSSGNTDDLTANPLALNMAQNLLLNPDLLQKLQASIQATGPSQNSMDIDFNSSAVFSDHISKDNGKMSSEYGGSSMQTHESAKHERMFGRPASRSRSRSPNSGARKSRFRDRPSYKDKDERMSYRYDRDRERERERERIDRNDRPDRVDRTRTDRRYRSRSKSPRNTAEVTQASVYEAAKEKEREKERERRKKGLPAVKKGYVTICSTTLWLGHLPKATSEVNISDALGEFGTINTIDHISARGCAYVCMNRRQDAVRAIHNLKNLKFNNANIKMAWAPGKGMKDKEFKDYWDVESGVSYIPDEKLTKNVDLELLEDGGCIDEDTVPEALKQLQQERKQKEAAKNAEVAAAAAQTSSVTPSSQPQQPPLMPPPVPVSSMSSMGPVGLPPFAIGVPPHAMNALAGPPRLLPPNAAVLMPGRLNPMLAPPPPPPPVEDDSHLDNDDDDDDITIIDSKSNGGNGSSGAINSNASSADSPIKPMHLPPSAIPSLADFVPHSAMMGGPPHLGLPPNMLPGHPRGPIPWLPGGGPHPQLLGHPNMPMMAGQPIRLAFHPDKRNGMFRHDKPMRPPLFDMPPMDPSMMHRPPRPLGHLSLPGGSPFGPMSGHSKFFK
jgi:RNA-binding protein 16